MIPEPIRNMLKQGMGITDEDLDRMSPGLQKLMSAAPQMMGNKIIAEVIDAKYCAAGVKPGDKIVVGPGPTVNAQESTCPLCIGILGRLMPRVHEIWTRMAEGLDPNEMVWKYAECYDPGLEHGGLGKVHFKLSVEKIG